MHKTSNIRNTIPVICLMMLSLVTCRDKAGETLSFPVASSYDFIGTVESGDGGEHYFCFAKKRFRPNVMIFDAKGALRDSISLAEAEKSLGSFFYVEVKTLDSILVYSHYEDAFVFVDRTGAVISKKSFRHISDNDGRKYYYLPPYLPAANNRSRELILTTLHNYRIGGHGEGLLSDMQKDFLFCKINTEGSFEDGEGGAHLFGVKFTDICEFRERAGESIYFTPYFFTGIVNGRIFMFSVYSRYLYELNESLSIETSIQIIGDDDPVVLPIAVDDENNMHGQALVAKTDSLCRRATLVDNILFNRETQNYIVILQNDREAKGDRDSHPFRIDVYDREFSKRINHLEFDTFQYNPKKTFILSGDLYIEKKIVNLQENKREYEIIKI